MLTGMATTTPPRTSDEDLAARCDLTGLYERYAHRLLAFVSSRGVPSHDLDDTLQEVWVRVHNGLKARPFSGHFSGWLFQIARNVLCDRARKPASPDGLPAEELNANVETPESILTRREIHDQLARCLERLDDRERQIVRARSAGEGYEDVCVSLNIEINTAYKIFHKAKAQLAECMKRAGYEPGSGDHPR
jgi:RNA polymerase sigma factor (sigma-70 family)